MSKGYITVSDGNLSRDTNRDLKAMYDAHSFSPRRSAGRMTRQRCNEIRACIGMDNDTLNHFFAQCDAKPVHAGPIASYLMASINTALLCADGDGELLRDERHYVCDIADVLGASVLKSVRASILDTLTTAGAVK